MSLALSAAAGFVAAGILFYVAHRLGTRIVTTPEGRAAFTCYRVWWYLSAAVTLITPLRTLAYLGGHLTPWLYQASVNLAVVLTALGLWALLCNLLYLYTGTTRWWGPMALFYVGVAAWFLGLTAWTGQPQSIGDDGWSLLAVASRSTSPELFVLSILVLLGPQLLAALAYLGLVRHAPGRTQRYRIVLVAGSILLWFGSAILATILAIEGAAGAILPRLVGILAALMALVAYDPPGWVRRRFGVKRAGDEGSALTSPIAAASLAASPQASGAMPRRPF